MSWRSSSNDSRYRSRNDEGSAFGGGSAGGPPLIVLIGAALLGGLVMIIVMIASGGSARQPVAAAPTATPVPLVVATTAPVAPTAVPAPAAGGGLNAVDPAGSDAAGAEAVNFGPAAAALAFAQTELSLKANAVVTLNFENKNDLGVQHNWVLVGSDTADAAAAVNAAAAGNSAALFVPPAGTENALAWTPMVAAGSTGSVTFRTPDAGTYLFICTFPGHYAAGMQGTLTVTN
jgi:azurin